MGKYRDAMDHHLRLRNLSDRTRKTYLAAAARFVAFHMVSPDQLGRDDVEAFLLHLRDELGLGPSSIKVHIAALRYLFGRVLDRPEVMADFPFPKVPFKRPEVLTREEAAALIDCTDNPKHKALLSVAYDCGLRVGEAVVLQARDIDAPANLIHIRQGKGGKDRVVRLGHTVLMRLRRCWAATRPPGPWIFAGRRGHLSVRAAQHAVKAAARRAQIRRPVCFHTLRHSFATHMLEAGAHAYTIQVVMGHKRERTTRRYLQISAAHIAATPGPLDLA